MDQPQTNLIKATQKFFKLLKLEKKDISSIYFFAILNGLIALILPLGIQTIISFVMAGSVSTSIIILIIIVVFGVFLNGLVQVRQMQIIEKVRQKIFTRYTIAFADKLPKLNIEKLDSYYLPELVNRYFDVPSLTKSIDKILLDVPTAIIQIVFGLILLSFYHPIFIAFGAVLLISVMIIVKYTSSQGLATSLKASDYKYSIAGWLEEMARVIKSFKYSKSTNLHIHKTDELTGKYLEARTEHFKILLTQYWSLIAFKIIITASMLIVGTILLVNQQINVGQFIAADIVILAIISSVEKLIATLDKVYDTLTSIQKLSKVLDSEVEHSGSLELPDGKGVEVTFNNISFCYNDNQVLHNISFSAEPGQMVCITGKSGSGKSTLLRLLSGAFTNYDGSILIDNVPLMNYNLKSLRSKTGILLSQQDIFNDTVINNLTMGNKDISLNSVTELAEKLYLFDFIKSQKNGFDTVLDPLGKKLSANLRQEILLIRALLGNRRLLLLESPFNNLDNTEKTALFNYLKQQKDTTVIIACDDEFVHKQCDKVIRLDKGRISI